MKKLAILMLMVMLISVMGIGAYAYNITDAEWAEVSAGLTQTKANNLIKQNYAVSSEPDNTTGIKEIKYKNNSNTVLLYCYETNGSDIYLAVMGTEAAPEVVEKEITNGNVEDVRELINGIKLKPGLEKVEDILNGMQGVLETVLGVVVWFIVIGVTFFGVTDILYLSYPVFQDKVNTSKEGNGPKFMSKIVTRDAIKSLEEAKDSNPILVYLKHRIIAMVALAICLYFVLIGDLGFVVNLMLKLFGGIINGIYTYANG